MRTCKKCNGTGVYTNWKNQQETCDYCEGKGYLPVPDVQELINTVTTTRGAEKGQRRFRNSPPVKWADRNNYKGARAYFVWRMARFHGGADVTMPIEAETCIRHDPYEEELDQIAGAIAKMVFGTDMAAAYRWGSLLGYVKPNQIPAGLPSSAYFGGFVHDGNKPLEELAELY